MLWDMWGICLNSLSVQGTSEARHINIPEMTAALRSCQAYLYLGQRPPGVRHHYGGLVREPQTTLAVIVSPSQHHLVWEIDALNISCEVLDAYASPPTKSLTICKDTQTQLLYSSDSSQVAQTAVLSGDLEPAVCAALRVPLLSAAFETS